MDFNANQYNETNVFQSKRGKDLILKIVAENSDKKFDIVLDIGCGSGNVTVLLDSQLTVRQLYGIDVDKDMIAFAKQNNTKDNISYISQDFGVEFDSLAPELQALEGKVSLIFSNQCLHWISDKNKEKVVKNCDRLLSKGGKIYANIVCIPKPFMDSLEEKKTIYEKMFMKIPERLTQLKIWINLFKSNAFDVICEEILENEIIMKLKDCKKHHLSLGLTLISMYFDERDMQKIRDNVSSIRLLSDERHFTHETTGEDMIAFNNRIFQLVLQK